jgi:phospholipase/carboxylesterase
METLTLGPLKVRRIIKSGATRENNEDKSPLTVVLCHGFGAPGDDLVGLAQALDVPPGTALVFPQAPHALEDFIGSPMFGDARAWWLIDIGRLERAIARGELRDLSGDVPDGLAEARAALAEMLDALAAEDRDRRLVLGGFSQGSMLTIDLALREPERKLSGLVALSGTMIAEREWLPLMNARKGTPVFQSHGQSDAILPFAIAERLREALSSAGLPVTFDPFAGPHTITPRTLERLGSWLRTLP